MSFKTIDELLASKQEDVDGLIYDLCSYFGDFCVC